MSIDVCGPIHTPTVVLHHQGSVRGDPDADSQVGLAGTAHLDDCQDSSWHAGG